MRRFAREVNVSTTVCKHGLPVTAAFSIGAMAIGASSPNPPAMPKNASEEPPPSAGEAAPAPVSILADSVVEAADQLESVKLSDQDEARPPADEGETKPKEDPDLWKPHAPTEECPVCLVPLPVKCINQSYWSCCGKLICTACSAEHGRAQDVTNRKRDKKKLPRLEKTCAFCRSPYPDDSELISCYEERIKKGDTVAMQNLAHKFRVGDNGLRKDEAKAVELTQMAAGLGSAEAIGQLGYWASKKERHSSESRKYVEEAVVKGCIVARATLASLLADEDNYDLAIKHWHLSAAAGCEHSMKGLWKCFSKGKLSKPELEKALRAHKAACDEMNSEERERFDACKIAQAGNDVLLNNIYASYSGAPQACPSFFFLEGKGQRQGVPFYSM